MQGAQSPLDTFGRSLLNGIVPGLNLGGQQSGQQSGLIPGFMGLAQAGDDPALQQQWAQQTGEWVAQWGANTLLSLGTTLMSGFLGLFGAEGLMNSPYLAAVGKTVGHFGNLAGQMSQPAGTGTGGSSITPSDGTVIDTSTMTAVSGTGTVPGGPGAVPFQVTPEMLQQLYSSGALTPAAQRAIEFAQTHAVGQPYDYSGVGLGHR